MSNPHPLSPTILNPPTDEEDEWQTVGPDDDDDAANGDRLGPGVFFGGAVEDELEDDAKPITGSGLRSAKELMAPPTREEMAQLHETQQLFRSNLLRMQLEEMLPTLHVKPARRKAISEALHRLRALLLAIPAQQRRKVNKREGCVESDRLVEPTTYAPQVSLSDPPSKCAPPITVALHSADDLSFVFKPPSNGMLVKAVTRRTPFIHHYLLRTPLTVAVVGSFMVSTQARPDVSVDVAVELPTGMFEDKDRLNHRYAHLRAYYLGVLADALSESDDFVDVEFTNFQVGKRKGSI